MKDIEIVLENLSSKEIKVDQTQKLFLEAFLRMDSKYKPPSLFNKKNNKGNCYLWGQVGRGKTVLLDAVRDVYFPESGRFHFIEFMQLIHNSLSNISNTKDPLIEVSKKISKEYKMIFIDEFQIDDIADAMIMKSLIESLTNHGVRLIFSSNTHPDYLYKDGLQRSKFLQTIDYLKFNFKIFHLSGTEDYRLREVTSFNLMENDYEEDIKEFLNKTFQTSCSKEMSFSLNSRLFGCNGHSKNFVWLSFKDFFREACSSKDFIVMTKEFDWVFISDFHQCNDDHMDKIRRFISFIDINYQEKQKLKLFIQPNIIKTLYQGEQLKDLWDRTSSRLHQILSDKYLENLEKN